MLILTRRIGESVFIGEEIRLTVLGVRGTQVRIGINAPKDVPVHREEIYYRIKNEQSEAGDHYDHDDHEPDYNQRDPYDSGQEISDYADPHNS